MYEKFYGLRESPFSLTPDPEFLFINKNFREALDKITYGINRREAFAVVIGDVGTGKTTLCWALLARLKKNVRTALILNPLMDSEDMLRAVIQDFGIRPAASGVSDPAPADEIRSSRPDPSWLRGLTRKELVDHLYSFLLEGGAKDLSSVLLIDEAQHLSPEVLEQLRILSNLEGPKEKLLQIVFSGQLELDLKLKLPELRQLAQRITVRCELKPLSRDDSARYIYHRLWVAGAKRTVTFTDGALKTIYKESGGYPRLINIFCDRSLLEGYKARSRIITAKMVRGALKDAGRTERMPRRIPIAALLRRALPFVIAALAMILVLAYFTRPTKMMSTIPEREQAVSAVPAKAAPLPKAPPTPSPSSTPSAPKPEAATPAKPRAGSAAASPAPGAAGGTREGSRSYLLQVHSLDTQQQAESAVARLSGLGYPALYRIITNADGSTWYAVYVGPFEEFRAAQATAETLLQREQLQTLLRAYGPPGR